MKAYWMKLTDAGSELEIREVASPTPGEGQVVVRMQAMSLNRGEFVAGHGLHGASGSWKAIGGEGSGEVVSVGPGVGRIAVGDRVMGRCSGAFAEEALMEASEAMMVPEGLSPAQAASIPLTYLVAFDMLVLQGRLQADDWLLINGVSSGVGVASLQMGKMLGARVIGTSGSPAKLESLRALGLDVGIETRRADFAAKVVECTMGQGADLVVNTVGGSVFAEDIRCMAFEGRLATVGYVDGVVNADLDLATLHAKRLTLFGVSNKLRTKAQRSAAVPRFESEILPRLVSEGRLPRIDGEFAFEQLPDAKARMEEGGHVGKIVLRPPAS